MVELKPDFTKNQFVNLPINEKYVYNIKDALTDISTVRLFPYPGVL